VRRRFRAFVPQLVPYSVSNIPVKTGKYITGIGAVAVIIRPPAKDGVDLFELFAKADEGGVTPCQLLDPVT
jgi:hypothetical protein